MNFPEKVMFYKVVPLKILNNFVEHHFLRKIHLSYGYNRRKSETEKRERFSENQKCGYNENQKIGKRKRFENRKIGNVVTMADFWSRFSVSDFRSL